MAACDLTIATGGKPMVRAAYSSGKPAYRGRRGQLDHGDRRDRRHRRGRAQHAHLQDLRLRLGLLRRRQSADRRPHLRPVPATRCSNEGGYLANDAGEGQAGKGDVGRRGPSDDRTRSRVAAQQIGARSRASSIPADRKFIIVEQDGHRQGALFSSEKLTTLLARLQVPRLRPGADDECAQIYEVGGKGHSCGIYSFDDDHISSACRWSRRSAASWCASRSRRPTPARSTTACR